MTVIVSPDPQFVHLRMHSEYSVVDGLVRLDDAVAAAAADGQPALALTDLSNLFGLIRFYKAARGVGLKPIAGADVWITGSAEQGTRTGSRQLLLARNEAGYLALCQLLSRGYLENGVTGRAELRFEWFKDVDASGLIVLSGAEGGEIGLALAANRRKQAVAAAKRWSAQFPGAFYLEVQRYGQAGVEAYIDAVVDLAIELELPVVATHPVQFMKTGEFIAHEARICIAEGEILANPKRQRRFTPDQFFKTQAQMVAAFADLPSALANAVEIARRCTLELKLNRPSLPLFPTPDGRTLDEHLRIEAEVGLERRLAHLYPESPIRDAERPRYASRLAYESAMISKMGFPGYFLIVADFISWAKTNGVPVGPGRGSGAGSLVAYSLGITDLDPLEYGLLFERFLNPDRVSMPDFDIDFCQEGRDRVIDYVKGTYGAQSVAQISTFGTMAAKSAIRDVGRVLDLPYGLVNGLSQLIPFKPGGQITIAEAKIEEPALARREVEEPEVRELLALAEQVEGITRSVGMHAGGVLIAPGHLTDFTPLYSPPGPGDNSANVVSQYDKDDVESAGLVKFDFLGLTTLTILDWTAQHIRRLHPDQKDFRLEDIPLDDPKTYEVFRLAETVAVFQFESAGMRRMLTDAGPDRFGDIIALVALFRPGPMDLIPDFIARKQGERFEYPDPRVKEVLEETYGIMVYQEQVMQMAQIIGGYSLGGADLLRRAMGKKKKEEMDRHESIFVEGARKNGLSAEKASEIFNLMAKFAGYGFNKSHAAAYALLAVQTAWLKAHYPAEFFAANLSAAKDDTDKVKILIDDARHHGLTILPPCLNASEAHFMPVRSDPLLPADAIRYGLAGVKDAGMSAVQLIVQHRPRGGYKGGVHDLCARVDKKQVNRRLIEALVRAGAFDALSPAGRSSRASVLAQIGQAIEAATAAAANANQNSLFGADVPAPAPPPPEVVPWTDRQALLEEKTALGHYLSGNLFTTYEPEVREFVLNPIGKLFPTREPQTTAGVIVAMRPLTTRRGKMFIATIDDGTGQMSVSLFNDVWEANRQFLKEDELVVLQGPIRQDDYTGGLTMAPDLVMDLAHARTKFSKGLRLAMNGKSDAKRLQALLEGHRAADIVDDGGAGAFDKGCRIRIAYHTNAGVACELDLGDAWRVIASDSLVGGLRDWLEPANVMIDYGAAPNPVL